MRIDAITTFPAIFDSYMGESMMKIAQNKGLMEFHAHNLRDWTHDRHCTTDDDPYGGGHGLIMKCEPIFEAFEAVSAQAAAKPHVIFLAPQGRTFCDAVARELSVQERLLFVCGHYEGIDQRAYTLADDVISIGDYVLTSGELAATVIIDAVVRQIPGVLGDERGPVEESFSDGLLEFPQYTRPAEFRGMAVPDVLLSGNHALIDRWRHEQSLLVTRDLRPDLLAKANLSPKDLEFLQSCPPADRE